jgi:hypothetical protein
VYSLHFAVFQRKPQAMFMLQMWTNFGLFVLMVVPLMNALLRERFQPRSFVIVLLAWLVAAAAILGSDAWWKTGSLWPTRLHDPEFRNDFLALNATLALATALNSLAIRAWGYRWRSTVRSTEGTHLAA